ncbi:MAG: SAM-dependent methyltransferase [Salibacteraceae bacterium]|jgi:SAM-dependent methyltransferase
MVTDIYGKALLKYQENPGSQKILVHSDIAESDSYPISWFFRPFKDFPELEKMAIELCSGRVLDVGAGTGIHSLELQNRGLDVTAIDISEGAISCMKKQGLKKAIVQDFYTLQNQKYDTLLLLMNGFGVMGKLNKVAGFFEKVNELLAPGGQIIVDSSDLLHLYKEEDGSVLIDLNGSYYGEVEYQMEFEDQKGFPFDWLFIDFGSMQDAAKKAGFNAVKIFEEETYQYLAKITRI